MRSEESHRSDIGSPIPSARPTSPEAPPTRHVPDDSAAFDIQDVLHGFAKDPASSSVDNVLAARSIVANSILSPDWHAALADEARAVYNLCLQKQVANRQDIMLATTHMRALCLALTEASKEVAPACDMDRGMHAKHWARTGLQFVILGEVDEAQRSLDASSARLRDFDDAHSVELLECELHLCGYRAHLAWRRDDFKQVLKHVEEAHTLLEERGGTQWILASSRQYLSEHVALRLARRSFEISEEGGASSAGGTGVVAADGADAADGVASAGVERREQLRLLDLALAVLGSNAASTDALDEIDLASLRDRILRLRAWLCMLEDEIDAATHSLQQHSNATSPEYMMLRCALLFRSNQPSAASALTVDWLREQTDLPHDVASDAIKLLTDSQAHASALVAANLLSERLARSDDLSAPCAGGTSTLGAEYSDLQEVKYRLLTESVPDQAAAEEHLELVLDGHCSGRLPLEELTLRGFASKLWASGCEKYAHGDLHRTVGDFERAFRFLEHTRQRASQARAQSTLGHMYLQQDRLEQAVDRASNCLKLIPQRRAGESDALDALDALSGAPGSGADDTDDWDTSQSLAMITLVKAKIKQGDAAAAHAQIDALLTRHPDHLLLAAICEELASLGSAYHAASIQILESFVNRLAELPAAAAQDKEGGEAGGASQRSMRTALLTDLQAIARRLARDGAAVCDDPAHIEWLADQAWHLAWVEGQRVPAELGESSVSGSDEHESQTLRFCADFVEASADLTAALPATEARLGLMRSAQLVICRAALRLAAAKPISETAEREHLTRAAKAMDAAFRLHQRYSHACRTGDGPADSISPQLHVLNFEIALRRRDPNAKDYLRKVSDESCTVAQLRTCADHAFECRQRELGVLALEMSLGKLMHATPRHHSEIAAVLRQLMHRSASRHAAWQYMQTALRLLEGYSAANAPFATDELQWLLAESWNRGCAAFRETKLEDAESWMAAAFKFSGYSSALAPWREELNEGYQARAVPCTPVLPPMTCLRKLNEQMGAHGRSKAADWKARMGKRILEADDEHARKKSRAA